MSLYNIIVALMTVLGVWTVYSFITICAYNMLNEQVRLGDVVPLTIQSVVSIALLFAVMHALFGPRRPIM